MRYLVCLGWALLVLLELPTSAAAADRIALVIGNASYRSAPRLANPRDDATDVAAALERNGFEVLLGLDLDKASMDEYAIRFSRRARTAEVAIIYYSGHALQFAGVNYLLPVDVELTDTADLRRLVRVDDLANDLRQAGNVRILVLDACRDNPFVDRLARSVGSTRAVTSDRGLARIDNPQGMIVSYATQPGQTADDGNGRNSPYTEAFLRRIQEPEEIGTVFRRITADVYARTSRKQLPELSLSMVGEFYLRGRPAAPNDTAGAPVDPCGPAERHWSSAEAIGTKEALEDHVARYPDCAFAGLARARIAALTPASKAESSGSAADVGPDTLLSERDMQRVRAIATKRDLPPLPALTFATSTTASSSARKLIGVWSSETGFGGVGRHAMLVISDIDARGGTRGYYLWGPPTARSPYKFPRGSYRFDGNVVGDQLTFKSPSWEVAASSVGGRRLLLEHRRPDGSTMSVMLAPAWRLVDAEVKQPLEGSRGAAVQATPDPDRAALVQAVQRELKRVGCYDGAINGDWSADTRSALNRFNDHARVALTTATPEPEAVTVLHAAKDRSCPDGSRAPRIKKPPAQRAADSKSRSRNCAMETLPQCISRVCPTRDCGLRGSGICAPPHRKVVCN